MFIIKIRSYSARSDVKNTEGSLTIRVFASLVLCDSQIWLEVVRKGGKDPHPQDFSLTKKTARFTKGQFRPYQGPKTALLRTFFVVKLRSRPPFTGVLLGPGAESAPRSAFWAILGTCLGVPQRVLFECFLAFFGPKNAKKHSKSTLWGTPRQVPKIAQKALRGHFPARALKALL